MFACLSDILRVENTVRAKKGERQGETKKKTVRFLAFDKRPAKVKLHLMLVCGTTLPFPMSPCT